VCIGSGAGAGIVSASNQVAINVPAAGPFADISNSCFIGTIFDQPVSDPGTAQDTFVDQFNVLGFVPSSRRVKHDIKPMDKASEVLYGLNPVTFKYDGDKKGRTQYGLIAEDVAEVAPDLVFYRKDGEVNTVRFEQIGSMLLNEFLKEHKKVQALEATVAQQQKGMEVLTAQLKEQAAQIQKVSAQLEVSKPAPQVVANKP
jgi:Chaperone of endosialidase